MKLDWNMGGWFGSQLGGTVWILVSAAISLGHDIPAGLVVLLVFLVPNIVGSYLWFRRPLPCYPSLQIVLALCGLAGTAAIYVLDKNDLWLKIQTGGAISKELAYLLLIITVLAVMASLHMKFGRRPDDS